MQELVTPALTPSRRPMRRTPGQAARATAFANGALQLAAGRPPGPMFKGFAALDKGKTFRPRRHHKTGTKRYELHKHAQATLGAGNLHDAVTLPEGEDANEWLAVNTVDFFNEMCAAAPDGRSSHRRAPRPAPASAEANHAVPRVAATCCTGSSPSSARSRRAPSCAPGQSTSTCGRTAPQ